MLQIHCSLYPILTLPALFAGRLHVCFIYCFIWSPRHNAWHFYFTKYKKNIVFLNERMNKIITYYTCHVQFSSVAQLCLTLCDPMNHSTPGLPMPSSHLILCCPLFLLPPIPSSVRVFSNESILRMRWPKYWSFSFRIISSKEHPGLISFRMDWLDLLAVQGTLKSLLQHHSSKASIRHSNGMTFIYLLNLYSRLPVIKGLILQSIVLF